MSRAEPAGLRPTIPVTLAFYLFVALAALVWDALREGPSRLLPSPEAVPVGVSVVAGLTLAALVILLSQLLERRFVWARRLSRTLAETIGPLSTTEIAVFSLASGIAEEMLFRGAMQPTLGLWLTSLIFGLAHGYLDRRFVPWMVMAGLSGLALGLLAEWTGSLLAPVLAHFTINYFEFHGLNRHHGGKG